MFLYNVIASTVSPRHRRAFVVSAQARQHSGNGSLPETTSSELPEVGRDRQLCELLLKSPARIIYFARTKLSADAALSLACCLHPSH